jgi:hypothetical protein
MVTLMHEDAEASAADWSILKATQVLPQSFLFSLRRGRISSAISFAHVLSDKFIDSHKRYHSAFGVAGERACHNVELRRGFLRGRECPLVEGVFFARGPPLRIRFATWISAIGSSGREWFSQQG